MPRWKQIVLSLALCLLPAEVFAQTLACNNGGPVSGTVLFPVVTCQLDMNHIFSGLNCIFHTILNDVMSRMYCGIQYSLMAPLAQALTLFVLLYALAFTVGISELTARELVTRLIKVALIWSFAMNASWGIGVGFNFLANSIETIAGWVLGGGGTPNFFIALDQFLISQVAAPFTGNGARIMAFFVSLWYALPPLFFLFLYLMIKVITVLIRALVSYLLGLTLIAFLISLSPIFVSFALFQVTYHFFETWLRYLISMALQIILVFAAVAVWLMVMGQYAYFFNELGQIIISYTNVLMVGASRTSVDIFGVCPITVSGMHATCSGGGVIPPTAFPQNANLIWYLIANLITMSVIAYAFDTFIKQIPDLARQLAGPQYVPTLSGGSGASAIALPGFTSLRRYEQKAVSQFKQQASQLLK